ncbi:MAG: NAD(+) synthase [Peptococcaceae bacterium]|nr:NAD(+) synthase [Peptococcaceae bacterium]
MQYGLIKTAVAVPDLQVADCLYNTSALLKLIKEADQQEVRVLIFPELSLTAASCGDLFFQPTLLQGALNGLAVIAEETKAMEMLIAVGLPLKQQNKLYNCAVILYQGRPLAVIPQAYPQDLRHFAPAPQYPTMISLLGTEVPFGSKLVCQCQQMSEFALALEIGQDFRAPLPPSAAHCFHGAYLIGSLSAEYEITGSSSNRKQLINCHSERYHCAYLYANAGNNESTTDYVYAGHSLISENGLCLAENTLFTTGLTITDIDVYALAHQRQKNPAFVNGQDENYFFIPFSMELAPTKLTRQYPMSPFIPQEEKLCQQNSKLILSLQAQALKKRFVHSHAQTLVIGISGGLDSCLALLVAVETVDLLKRSRSDIVAVTMPCFGTTERTKSNAELLCQYLGVSLRTIDIGDSVKQHFQDIEHDFGKHDVTFENSQARERTQILMDIANQTNGLVIGTGDLSELALGWATYNGDHMSMYGVNASIPKTLIRQVVADYAEACQQKDLAHVLQDILATPVSPELLPANTDGNIAQKTEDLVGPYELHDFFLYYALYCAYSPEKIYHLACHTFAELYTPEVIGYWLKTFFRRFFQQQFKRSCLPDGPKVTPISLSPRGAWQMPSDAAANLWLEELQ